MNMKKSLILLAVAAVVCIAVYVDYSSKPHGDRVTESASGEALEVKAFGKVTPDSVERIEVFPPGKKDAVVLKKDSGEWKVEMAGKLYRISKDRADRLFGKKDNKYEIDGPMTLDFQARNPENHADFDLTDAKATRVKFYDGQGNVLEDLLVGKNGNDWQSTFVRFPGKNEVYLAPVRLADRYSGADANAWRDKRLFPDLKAEDIYRIHVDDRANTRTFTLEKEPAAGGKGEGTWYVTEPFRDKARATSAQSATRTLANLTATDFVTTPSFTLGGFEKPTLIARFDVKDHPTTPVLTLGAETQEKSGRYFAKTNLSNETYIVYKPYGLSVTPESLKETPTPTPSPTPTPPPTATPETSTSEQPSTGTAPAAAPVSGQPVPTPLPTVPGFGPPPSEDD